MQGVIDTPSRRAEAASPIASERPVQELGAGFSRLLSLGLDMLATADGEGYFTSLNPAWTTTLGWSQDELMSTPFVELVHPEDREATVALTRKVGQPGFEVADFENRYRCRDGSYRWLSWRAWTDGSQWYAVARDATARKQDELSRDELVARMRSLVIERTRGLRSTLGELEVMQTEVVRRLSMAVEYRDDDTGQHIDRVSRYSGLLARRAGLDAALWEPMRFASPLHDAGKVSIPDAVLLKPGKLTPEERAVMETHAHIGYELLRGSASPTLDLAATIAWTHHEKYDGSGYPRGLAGEAIPIEGRIVAIVDVFDALTSDRVYRPAFPIEEALGMMRRDRGTHFDPQLFDVFLEYVGEMSPRPLSIALAAA